MELRQQQQHQWSQGNPKHYRRFQQDMGDRWAVQPKKKPRLESHITHHNGNWGRHYTILPSYTTTETGYRGENAYTHNMCQRFKLSNSANVPIIPIPEKTAQPVFNLKEFYQRLTANGLVKPISIEPTVQLTPFSAMEPRTGTNNGVQLKAVDFSKPKTLRVRNQSLINLLHSGKQCSNCGMRFKPEEVELYSQHLDWHFRQNHRARESNRKVSRRGWYYNFADWTSHEEQEDLEEKKKSFFEEQFQKQQREAEEKIEIPCVPAEPNVHNPVCYVCHETFEEVYNQDEEEWQLQHAIRIDSRTYHPVCYEDHQNPKVDGDKSKGNDDDDDDDGDDVVIINDPIPETIVIDDDDDDDEDYYYKPRPRNCSIPGDAFGIKSEPVNNDQPKSVLPPHTTDRSRTEVAKSVHGRKVKSAVTRSGGWYTHAGW